MRAIEDDLIDIGKISFSKTPSGAFHCTVVYHEIEIEKTHSGWPKPDHEGKSGWGKDR